MINQSPGSSQHLSSSMVGQILTHQTPAVLSVVLGSSLMPLSKATSVDNRFLTCSGPRGGVRIPWAAPLEETLGLVPVTVR